MHVCSPDSDGTCCLFHNYVTTKEVTYFIWILSVEFHLSIFTFKMFCAHRPSPGGLFTGFGCHSQSVLNSLVVSLIRLSCVDETSPEHRLVKLH